jgi:ligand-binding sensor domain-containing protein/two-component sensor histidine kinase
LHRTPITSYPLFIFLLALSFYSSTSGQAENIRFDHLTLSDGLVHDIITAIVQDSSGFIWIGTEDGLMKYDSYNFTVLKNNPEIKSSLRDDWITKLFVDSKGRIWIGTSAGIDRYDKHSSSFVHYQLPVKSSGNEAEGVALIYEDSENKLFIYTNKSGLCLYDESRDKFYKTNFTNRIENLIKGYITFVFQDSEGTYWICSTEEILLWKIDGSFSYHKLNHPDTFDSPYQEIFDVAEDSENNIWIGSKGGLTKFIRKTGRIKNYYSIPNNPYSLCHSTVLKLFIDSNNNLWLGTFEGLNKYIPESDRFISYKHDPNDNYSLSANRIYDLFEDGAGTLWIGTYKGGISKIDPVMNRFTYYGHNPSVPGSISGHIIRSIIKDKKGVLWIGTAGAGLNRYDNKNRKFRHYKYSPGNPNGLQSNSVLWILDDSKGRTWFANPDAGLSLYIPATDGFQTIKANNSNGLKSNKITIIYEDKEGDFWVGTEDWGLYKFNPSTYRFTYFLLDPSQEKINIHSVFQDSEKKLWVGSFGGGLFKVDKKTNEIKKYLNNPGNPGSISSNVIYSISEDRKNRLWVSTFRGGLNLYNKETDDFTVIKEKDGLPSNYVKAAIADKNNLLWLPTNRGLVKFNPENNEMRIYNEKDGLRSNDFLSGAHFIDEEGQIYAGGSKGFISFHPETLKESGYMPPVVLTNFKLFDEPFPSTEQLSELKEVKLDYDQNFFSFEFAALEYSAHNKNRYAYMLEGVDRDWVYSGKRRFASYTHIEPGKYTFKVKTANSDGVWGKETIFMQLIINPPFWQTWWFLSLTFVALIILGIFLYNYRVNRLLEIERLKNRIASDLHDDIAANLSSIAMFSQIINDQTKEGNISEMSYQLMEKITSIAQESVTSVRDIIWALDPKEETVYDLLIKVRDTFITMCRAKDINFDFVMPDKEHLPDRNLTPEERKNLWLFIKEALNNSIKHSSSNELSLHCIYRHSRLNIVILDNGQGFDTSGVYKGKGLGTMRKRAENLSGNLSVVSNKGSGTVITLHFKI